MGCADPPSKGVGAPHQCSRVSKKRSGWGELLTELSRTLEPVSQSLQRAAAECLVEGLDLLLLLLWFRVHTCLRARTLLPSLPSTVL